MKRRARRNRGSDTTGQRSANSGCVSLGEPERFSEYSSVRTGVPAVALGVWAAASLARQLRSSLIDTLDTNYVRTSWAKGSRSQRVVGKHALKNAAIPAVTVLGLQLSTLLGGAVVIERIFSIPGLGSYLIAGINSCDIPVIQGVTVVFVLMYVGINLLVDSSYGYFNPRVRVG